MTPPHTNAARRKGWPARLLPGLPSGRALILVIAIATSLAVALLPEERREGLPFWTMRLNHYTAYVPSVAEWNRQHPEKRIDMQMIQQSAFERRMLSGFLTGTPVADLLEVSSVVSPKAFLGPLDQVGFYDMTDRLHTEGIYEKINEASFAPYTSRGRIFGIPHDVHPVLLAYRADIVEAAGIDVREIETWDDYFRVMRPLMADHDGDGRPDRYSLEFSEIRAAEIVMLMLQNGGEIFDEHGAPIFANERNAHVLATLATWVTGPGRSTVELGGTASASAHRQRLDGAAIGWIAPDWLLGMWKIENPGLSGKLKVMPLPAWERGGRRVSVAQGCMIGISKTSSQIDLAWEVALHLYTSAEVAESLYKTNCIISPVKPLWDEPFYDEPDPFFRGQAVGRLYIDHAPQIPIRTSSPYTTSAEQYIGIAAMALRDYAEQHAIYDAEALKPEALRLLAKGQAELTRLMSRNLLLEE
ncbi:hypothetical protein AXK11_05300 [Cephaloticoccus primus]|uniref:ABC transporter substrate-binding protein n=1 Tax=Cephaloticoccus primus TaxID=1548207 RepID=A0A139SN72_9BACT|nr:extracellular solute-binding protein [Cephaloticoccus primus]KXU35940.1 hypothetical protein AXK11_05300 [Cephaloticoccus primus]